jgi:hypothetical protein
MSNRLANARMTTPIVSSPRQCISMKLVQSGIALLIGASMREFFCDFIYVAITSL